MTAPDAVPPPRAIDPSPGTVWTDLALLGWARAATGALLALTAVSAFAAPALRGGVAEVLGVGGLVTWRMGVGALSGAVGLAGACWRARWTPAGTWAALLAALSVGLLLVDLVLLAFVVTGNAVGTGRFSADTARDALSGLGEVAAGLAEHPELLLALVVVGVLPGVVVFVCHAGRAAAPTVPMPGPVSVLLTALLRPMALLALLATIGMGPSDWDEGFVIAAMETAAATAGLALALALAAPARRALAARRR